MTGSQILVTQSTIVLISIVDSHPFYGSLTWKNTHMDLGEHPAAVCGPDLSIEGICKRGPFDVNDTVEDSAGVLEKLFLMYKSQLDHAQKCSKQMHSFKSVSCSKTDMDMI